MYQRKVKKVEIDKQIENKTMKRKKGNKNDYFFISLFLYNCQTAISVHCRRLYFLCCLMCCMYGNHSHLNLVRFLLCLYTISFAIAVYFPSLSSQPDIVRIVFYSHCSKHVSHSILEITYFISTICKYSHGIFQL